MSSVKTSLKLFKNQFLWNGSQYTYHFNSETERTAKFASPDWNKEVTIVPLGQPIVIEESLDVMLDYSYGIYNYNGKNIYIFIDSIESVRYGESCKINYTIDSWQTMLFSMDLGIGHISRRKGTKPGYKPQPVTSVNPTVSIEKIINSSTLPNYTILFMYVDDSTTVSKMKIGISPCSLPYELQSTEMGTWQEEYGISDSAVKGVWIVPFNYLLWISTSVWDVHNDDSYNSEWYSKESSAFFNTFSIGFSFTSNEISKQGICDIRGNSLWECPFNESVTDFTCRLLVSVSSCCIEFLPTGSDLGQNLKGLGFSYICPSIDQFIDSYTEYKMRQMDAERELRRLQSSKQVWSAGSDAIQGAGFGMAFGGATGFGAAALGGLINTASIGFANDYYDPKINEQEALLNKNMRDEMSIFGTSITKFHRAYNSTYSLSPLYRYTMTIDNSSLERYQNDVNNNGWYCDEIVSSVQQQLFAGNVLVADNVLINGTMNSNYRLDIAKRLLNGIRFLDPSTS